MISIFLKMNFSPREILFILNCNAQYNSFSAFVSQFFPFISGFVSTSLKFISRAISLWSTKDQSALDSSTLSRIVADWWDFSWEFLFCRSLNFFIISFIFCGNWCAIYIIAIIVCMILRIELVWTIYFLCEYFRCGNNKDFLFGLSAQTYYFS